jgi:iron complex outermembrane recepter protein
MFPTGQDVPITVTAITAQAISESGILTTSSLPLLTPGLVITDSRYAIQPYIRGVGTENAVVGEEGSVATYVDGVYIPSLGAASFSFNNIERVEILKGPQGTLFGRNATGGLIQIVTRDPGSTPEFEAGADYGTYNTVSTHLYASTPVAENLAVDLAIYEIHQFDGYGRVVPTAPFVPNPNIGRDVNYARDTSGRSKLVWTPDNATKVTLALDYDYNTTDLGEARTIFPGSRLEGNLVGLGNLYDTSSGTFPSTLNRQYGVSLHVDHDFDFAKLSSITAYRLNRVDSVLDQDTAPITLVSAYDTEQTKSWQQEFDLHGDVGRLDWTGGFFFFHDAAEQLPLETFSSLVESVNHEQFTKQNADAYALYGQGTYKFDEGTDVTAGIRYNEEYRKIQGTNYLLSPPYPAPTANAFTAQKANFGSPTARFAVDQDFTEGVMGYFSYDRGFKSGEFNNTNPNQGAVKPETIDAYEVGAKTEFLEHRLKLNAAAFYYDYTNIQLTALTFNNVVLTNAAKGKLKGLDFDSDYVPTVAFGRLELTAGLEALTAHYTSFPGGVGFEPAPGGGNTTITGADFSGNEMIRAPNWTLSATANYGFPIGPGSGDLNVALNHNSGFYWDPDNRLHQNAYDVLNAQFSYTTPDTHWKFKVGGANLLNKLYLAQVSSSASGDIVSAAPPRTASVGFDYKY